MSYDAFLRSYQERESLAKKWSSPFTVRAFSPVTFNLSGYPTSISSCEEIVKYCDSMQEGRYEANIALLGGGLNEEEFKSFASISSHIFRFTKELGSPVVPRNSLLRAFLHFRGLSGIAKILNKPFDKLSVLEIGPGSGFLGILCKNHNIKYWSLEAAQSFYITQHMIWSDHFGADQISEALESQSMEEESFVHVPWWTFVDRNFQIPDFDVIVCNHAVNEISNVAFSFILNRLKGSFVNGILLVEGWGGGEVRENVFKLSDAGLNWLHQVSALNYSRSSKFIPISAFRIDPKYISSKGGCELTEASRPKVFLRKILSFFGFLSLFRYILRTYREYKSYYQLELLTEGCFITEYSNFFKQYQGVSRKAIDNFFREYEQQNYSVLTEDEKFLREAILPEFD